MYAYIAQMQGTPLCVMCDHVRLTIPTTGNWPASRILLSDWSELIYFTSAVVRSPIFRIDRISIFFFPRCLSFSSPKTDSQFKISITRLKYFPCPLFDILSFNRTLPNSNRINVCLFGNNQWLHYYWYFSSVTSMLPDVHSAVLNGFLYLLSWYLWHRCWESWLVIALA